MNHPHANPKAATIPPISFEAILQAGMEALTATFRQQGFVVVTGLFSAEVVSTWRRECERLWALNEVRDPTSFRVDPRATVDGGRTAERMDPVIDVSPLFEELSRHPKVLEIAGTLLGETPVLFKDKLIFKMPGTTGYPLHQDFAYITDFGFSGHQQLAACIVIDATTRANGATEFFPGLHHDLLPSPAARPGEVDERYVDVSSGLRPELNPGDVVFFHSLCPHRAAPNLTDKPRRLLFFTYNTGSSGDLYDTYYRRGKP